MLAEIGWQEYATDCQMHKGMNKVMLTLKNCLAKREATSLDYKDWLRKINNSICSPNSEHLKFALFSVLEEAGRREDKTRQLRQFKLGRLHSSSKEHFTGAH